MPLIVLQIITSYEKGLLHWDLPLCGSPFPCSGSTAKGAGKCVTCILVQCGGKMSRFELAFLHFLYYNKEL